MIRVIIPAHLRTLARVEGEVRLEVDGPVTARAILDALEGQYPMLRGTVREHGTGRRRAFVRFFVSGRDVSFNPVDEPLPSTIAAGEEPFMIVGAIAGG